MLFPELSLTRALLAALLLTGSPFGLLAEASEPVLQASAAITGNPGELTIRANSGVFTIQGKDTDLVEVFLVPREGETIEPSVEDSRAQGLRRLTPVDGLSLSGEDDDLKLTVDVIASPRNYLVTVPRKIRLDIGYGFLDSVAVADVEGRILVRGHRVSVRLDHVKGEVEIETSSGLIHLRDVSGSVVAHTIWGAIDAVLLEVNPDRPMIFSTTRGHIDLTLPQDLGAVLRLKTSWGDIYTDFEVDTAPAEEQFNYGFDFRNVAPAPLPPLVDKLDPDDLKGDVKIAIAVPKTNSSPSSAFHGRINGGGVEIRVLTSSGNIYLRRGSKR